MKIRKFILFAIIIFLLISCSYEIKPEILDCKENVSSSLSSVVDKDYGSKSALYSSLIDYAVFNDYVRSNADIEEEISVFISYFKNISANSLLGSNNYQINKVHSVPIELESTSPVMINVYDIIFKSDPSKNFFIIFPNDRRIGDVLFISDNVIWSEVCENEYILTMLDDFVSYANEVLDVWDSITEEDINYRRAKYGSTRDLTLDSKFHIEYGEVKKLGSDEYIQTPEWIQSEFYNDAIRKIYKKNYLVGCGALSLGLVMNELRYPSSFLDIPNTKASLEMINTCGGEYSLWDGVFDWDGMKEGTKNYQISALLFNIAEGAETHYGVDGSSTSLVTLRNCLNTFNMNYDEQENIGTNYNGILSVLNSIENGSPVVATSNTHVYIIDGCKLQTLDKIVRRYVISPDSVYYENVTVIIQQSLLYHVNMGWGEGNGKKQVNGWYAPNAIPENHINKLAFTNISPKN